MTQAAYIEEILEFWFSGAMSKHWFNSNAELDTHIRDRFMQTWQSGQSGDLNDWRDSAEGCLALCIILDQFPLHMFRGEAIGFSTESAAIDVTLHAIDRSFDEKIATQQVAFLYMSLMHSEQLEHQDLCVQLFQQAGLDSNLRFAKHHRDLIRRFGRFPHRNAILGRISSEEEILYLGSTQAFTG